MRIIYTRVFVKMLKKSPPKIQAAFKKRLTLFIEDEFHPLLNNHVLSGELFGYRSLNITGDWRAIFTEDEQGVCFEVIGTHSKLYK